MGHEKVALSDIAPDALEALGGPVREARLEAGWTQCRLGLWRECCEGAEKVPGRLARRLW
ncbi:hypothetical protein GCM10020360_17020 [Nonlabens tegetincola]